MSARLRVVLDTNVFVSAARTPRGVCGRILDAAYAEIWTMVASEQLLDELDEVLHRPWVSDWLAKSEAEEFIAAIREIAEMVADPPPSSIRAVRDPNDEFPCVIRMMSSLSPWLDPLASRRSSQEIATCSSSMIRSIRCGHRPCSWQGSATQAIVDRLTALGRELGARAITPRSATARSAGCRHRESLQRPRRP